MNDFTTELVKTLLEGRDITEIFRGHIERAMNQLLQLELKEFLDYDKYDRKGFNSGNSRNGSYERVLKTEYGDLNLTMPRDRNEDKSYDGISRSIRFSIKRISKYSW